jgi:hypothetical protein
MDTTCSRVEMFRNFMIVHNRDVGFLYAEARVRFNFLQLTTRDLQQIVAGDDILSRLDRHPPAECQNQT